MMHRADKPISNNNFWNDRHARRNNKQIAKHISFMEISLGAAISTTPYVERVDNNSIGHQIDKEGTFLFAYHCLELVEI